MKKCLAFAVSALMTFSLTACGGGASPPTGSPAEGGQTAGGETGTVPESGGDDTATSGSLLYWSAFSGDSMTWDQKRVEKFKEEYPDINIEVQFVPESAGMRNGKLMSAIAGGVAPDILVADDYITAYGFAGQGAFEPWDPYLESIGISVDSFMPGFKNVMQYNGATYLLPQDSNVIMLYLNTDMVAAAGLDIEDYPRDLDQFKDWIEKLTILNDDGSAQQYGYIPWLDSTEDPTFWPFMFGAEIFSPETNQLTLTEQPIIDALNWQREFAKQYNATQIRGFTQSAGGLFSPDHPFFLSKVAMTVVGNWATNAMKIYAPQVNYRCVPIPVPAGGREKSTPLGSNVFAMPKGVKNPELAATFFKFTQRAEINADNFDIWRSIPCVDAAFDEVSWIKNNDPIYLMEREIANSPKSSHPALCAVSAELRTNMIALRDTVIYEDADPLPLLQELQDRLQPELDKAKQ